MQESHINQPPGYAFGPKTAFL